MDRINALLSLLVPIILSVAIVAPFMLPAMKRLGFEPGRPYGKRPFISILVAATFGLAIAVLMDWIQSAFAAESFRDFRLWQTSTVMICVWFACIGVGFLVYAVVKRGKL